MANRDDNGWRRTAAVTRESKVKPSEFDVLALARIRSGVTRFLERCAHRFDGHDKVLLDIAPQDWAGAREHFRRCRIVTLDIDPRTKPDVVADITRRNEALIASKSLDLVCCTEVLEHVLNPFAAVDEMHRVLKPGGYLMLTTPFNFRIHGPLPDCWRFTEHGIRALLSDRFEIVELSASETTDRPLMPIQYQTIARRSPVVQSPRDPAVL